jgi:hypothetical protein
MIDLFTFQICIAALCGAFTVVCLFIAYGILCATAKWIASILDALKS